MAIRYYSLYRPVAPGTFPKPDGNRILGIKNFDDNKYVEEINHKAWGFIEYEEPLKGQDISAYELKPAIM